MSERKSLDLGLYGIAFIITVVIFSIGVYVGNFITKTNNENLYNTINEITQRTNSIQLLLLLDDSPAFCSVYKGELEKLDQETLDVGYKLSYLQDVKGTSDVKTKKEYFILETGAYLLTKKINERCNYNSTLVLYFYSNVNCPQCNEQGINILKARDMLADSNVTNIKIYSFDGDLGSAVADALKQKHYVYGYPTIIVNDKAYTGYQDVDALIKIFKGEK